MTSPQKKICKICGISKDICIFQARTTCNYCDNYRQKINRDIKKINKSAPTVTIEFILENKNLLKDFTENSIKKEQEQEQCKQEIISNQPIQSNEQSKSEQSIKSYIDENTLKDVINSLKIEIESKLNSNINYLQNDLNNKHNLLQTLIEKLNSRLLDTEKNIKQKIDSEVFHQQLSEMESRLQSKYDNKLSEMESRYDTLFKKIESDHYTKLKKITSIYNDKLKEMESNLLLKNNIVLDKIETTYKTHISDINKQLFNLNTSIQQIINNTKSFENKIITSDNILNVLKKYLPLSTFQNTTVPAFQSTFQNTIAPTFTSPNKYQNTTISGFQNNFQPVGKF